MPPRKQNQCLVTLEEYKQLVRDSWDEDEFQRQVIDLAHVLRWKVVHFRKVRVQRKNGSCYWETPFQGDGKGFVDLILVRDGRTIFAELKVPPNKPSPEQEEWLALLRKTPNEVYVFLPADWEFIEKVLA